MTTISIHQPMYLPYQGYFNKMKNVDIFVIGDDVHYSKNYYYNRNRIKTPDGVLMLTIPLINKHGKRLNEVLIDNNSNWQKKHLNPLKNYYKKAIYFKNYIDFFEDIYSTRYETLQDLNMKTLFYLMEQLNINIPIHFTSELLKDYVSTGKTQRIIDICKKLDADVYLSGIGGKNYLDENLFKENDISLVYQNFVPREYKQLWGQFVPNLSIIDILFNEGENAQNWI